MLVLYFLLFYLCSSKELFEDYYEEAEKYLNNMTLEDKVSQMFIPKYVPANASEDLPNLKPGGYVLYAEHFNHEADYILDYVVKKNDISMKKIGLPLVLSVDEEGGAKHCRVSLKHRSEPFPTPQEIYNKSGIEGILKIDQEKRDLLRRFFLNVNLAPVADLSYNSSDYIFDRTIGRPANVSAEYIGADVEGYVKDNFTCCAKHFPGYGHNVDTHKGIGIDNRSYETFLEEDFKTFEAAIDKKVPMILVSHNIVKCKDPLYPASLSKTWIDILRNYLNFSGIVITDDISMQGIQQYINNGTEAILAANAGNDLIITNNFRTHRQLVIEAVKNGTIKEETINIAVRRVIAWKLQYLPRYYSKEEKKEDEPKSHTLAIVLGVIGGVIVIAIIVFVYLCFIRKPSNDSNENTNEDLLPKNN